MWKLSFHLIHLIMIVMTVALREFVKSLALFSKPLVAGVHGAAVGLGVTILPFFDMVFASDKATFYTPYAKIGQIPEGAAVLTLPHMLGNAVVSVNACVDYHSEECIMPFLHFLPLAHSSSTVRSCVPTSVVARLITLFYLLLILLLSNRF